MILMRYFQNLKYKKLIKNLRSEFINLSSNKILIKDIYKLVLPHKKIIFNYFENYLNFVFNYEKGQITENQDFGNFLKNTLQNEPLDVLEFGTWNGLGSTKIIFENSKTSDSIEINPFIYGIAQKNLMPIKSSNRLLIGRIIELEKTKINLKESFLSNEFNVKRNSIDMWLGHIIHLLFTCENISILNNLKQNYDLLLIDGGGLTTFDEFLIILPRVKKFIFLDDIDGIKGKKIFKFLNDEKKYELIFNSKTRHSCVFKKLK